MADPRPLRKSRRLRGKGPEVGSRESSYNLTPLQRFRPSTFTIDPKARDVELPRKHCKTEPLSAKERSDSFEGHWTEYFSPDFPLALLQIPSTLPSSGREEPLYQPFPFFDPNSPTFGIVAPPLSMEGPSSTVASVTSFSIESASPTRTFDMVIPSHIRGSDVSTTPTVSSIRAMVSCWVLH